jgi:beta-phosphoglucomutase-like phosphatase (HAD superfamily)
VIDAVVLDLDGLLLDTEQLWDEVRETLARERGGRWSERAQSDMMGMSSPEWSRYMHEVVGLDESPDEIADEVVGRMASATASSCRCSPARRRPSSASPRVGRSGSRRRRIGR